MQTERLCWLRDNVGVFAPLTVTPVWRCVDELRQHCEKRATETEMKSVKTMKEAELQSFLLSRTKAGLKLGSNAVRGVRKCPLKLVTANLSARGTVVPANAEQARHEMEQRLQLEQEWAGLEAACLDTRFDDEEWGLATDPSRHIIDSLHLIMRGNESILHMMMLKCIEQRGGKENAVGALTEMDNIIREIGQLGQNWSHKWDKKDPEALSKPAMPYDESKKIFNRANLNSGKFFAALSIIFHGNDKDSKKEKEELKKLKEEWKRLLKCYIDILHYLTLNREYIEGELDKLEEACNLFGDLLVRHCGGMKNVTNYYHDIVAGHVVQQSKEWGNLWRFRNEGVEAFNAMLSRFAFKTVMIWRAVVKEQYL